VLWDFSCARVHNDRALYNESRGAEMRDEAQEGLALWARIGLKRNLSRKCCRDGT
jgi:hypothetical protein